MSAHASKSDAAKKRVADLLLKHKVLTQDAYESVVDYVKRTGDVSEEGIIELGLMSEGEVLKHLAGIFRTNFVTTEKLSKVELPRSTLEMIPRKVAESLGVLPVLFDPKSNTLSVVTTDPDDEEMIRNLKMAVTAKEIRAFVARRAAIQAGFAKYFNGDKRAFEVLERTNAARWVTGLTSTGSERQFDSIERFSNTLKKPDTGRHKPISIAPEPAPPPPPPPKAAPQPPPLPTAKEREPDAGGVSHESFVELVSVMVSLLENGRQDLRGHSSMVARLVRRAGERMNLDRETLQACVVAAYVHDLGKMGQFHLTGLNCSEYEGHKIAAQKACETPLRLLEAVRLPRLVKDAVFHMYERFDGKGFPDGLAGKEIPLGARILAIADTYADLTNNPRNPYRKQLRPSEACNVLAKYRETIFDPNVVDLFRTIMMGEDIRAKLLSERHASLIVDSDPEETTVLELRLIQQGFEVKTARTIEQARKHLQESEIDLVISELEMPDGDGLALLEEARKESWGKDVHWVFHTRKQGRTEAQRAFALGCLDYVAKPVATDVFVAKLRALIDQRQSSTSAAKPAAGVSGQLSEMGLPDLVQVLFHGRKTGSLKIRAKSEAGEIHFLNGAVAQAIFGKLKGPDAFYAMCKLQDGEFALDPSFKPTEVLIKESAEALLLEGMRRMDEGI